MTNINRDNIFTKGVIGSVRKAQEDSHDIAIMTPNGDLFVVCDGMGGHVGGAKASSIAVGSIIEYFKKEKYNDIPQALNDAIQYANMQIISHAVAHPEFKGMGTTACIVLLHDENAYIAHVGDSRIYLYLGLEKKLHRVTKDHSYVQALVDKGDITDEMAEHHQHKNRILKALGIRNDVQPTIGVIKPKNGDIFLICTDGLNGMISDKTIEQVMIQDSSIEQKGEMLINLAMQGEPGYPGGQDNCTIELVKIDNSPHKNSDFISYNPIKKSDSSSIGQIYSSNSESNTNNNKCSFIKKVLYAVIALLLILIIIYGAFKFIDARRAQNKVRIEKLQETLQRSIDKVTVSNYDKTTTDLEIETFETIVKRDLKKEEQELKETLTEHFPNYYFLKLVSEKENHIKELSSSEKDNEEIGKFLKEKIEEYNVCIDEDLFDSYMRVLDDELKR